MKRFGAMLLTMAMLLSLAVTGVSAEGAESTTTPTVKIQFNGLGNEVGNDTLKAYRVIKYTNDSCNAFEGDNGIVNGETTFWKYLQSKSSGKDPAEYLENDVKDVTELRNLLNGFLTVSDGNTLKKTAAFTVTNNGETKQVETGYYILQVASYSKIYNTMLLFVGYKDGQLIATMDGDNYMEGDATQGYTATMKSEDGPTVKKFVFDDRDVTADGRAEALKESTKWKLAAASEVGKEVDFAIQVDLPTYHDDAAVDLTLTDNLQNLKYTGGASGVAVYYENKGVYTPIEGAIGDVQPGNYADGSQTMTIALNYSKLKATGATKFYVHYKATLTEDAVSTAQKGTNDVTLNYIVKTSAGEYIGAPKADEVTVYTYNFKLNKTYDKSTDAAKHTSDAVFSVYADANEEDVDASKVMYFKEAAEGKYYYPVASNVDGATDKISADFEIRGLDVNTEYYVKEVETPAGYYAPNGYFTLKLSGEEIADSTVLNGELKDEYNKNNHPYAFVAKKGEVDQVLVTNGNGDDTQGHYGEISNTKKYEYDVILNNSSTPVLPSTGGMGTTLFTVGGVALLALAAAMLILRRRKN